MDKFMGYQYCVTEGVVMSNAGSIDIESND